MADNSRELILAQNQFAFVQEEAKGGVSVWVGPSKQGLTPSDKPVVYDSKTTKFRAVSLDEAISQFIFAAEGSYVVVENPPSQNKHPEKGSNPQAHLDAGRKINIPGPITFPLWPGEVATVIEGHHLRSNQYLFVRIYNADEANKIVHEGHTSYTTGQQIVIKGTECSFYIPPNGFEVLKDTSNNTYVRDALTLERLEYCILLHENGNKRYERGPSVVFPEATEKFVPKKVGGGDGDDRRTSFKFKAIELDDNMGLYIKVIADYKEDTGEIYSALNKLPEGFNAPYRIDSDTKEVFVQREYKIGDELFITGKDQRIYYPQSEHALIQYKDAKQNFDRDRYYGIAIPKGEARYVLQKNEGKIDTVKGPQIFLPDPRQQVVVRRVLDRKTVELWYPGNQEALQYNENLRSLMSQEGAYVPESALSATSLEATRSLNRMTKGSAAMVGSSFQGDTLSRGNNYTPPRTITLDTKYEGVPLIGVWTGYAVQIVNKSGDRRIVQGPASIMLEYDESLEVMELSTGKPKTTDHLKKTVYLRTEANKISDEVSIETKDLVEVKVKLSYRVNFEGDPNRWFRVENYVKFLSDHLRSLLRAKGKEYTIERFVDEGTTIVRDTVLGKSIEGKRTGKTFEENGMRVYDVEVLNITIGDSKIATLLREAQSEAVQHTVKLQVEARRLEMTKKLKANEIAEAEATAQVEQRKHELKVEKDQAVREAELAQMAHTISKMLKQYQADSENQHYLDVIAQAEVAREKASNDEILRVQTTETDLTVKRLQAMNEKFLPAVDYLTKSEWSLKLATALAPIALIEQSSLDTVLAKLFDNTPLSQVVKDASKALSAVSGK